MSVYVDLYGITEAGTDVAAIMRTAKAKVTMKVPNENVSEEAVIITLYENGAPSTNEKAQFTNANGEKASIIKELKYHTDTKTVEAIFDPEYQAVEGVVYTLSFDVKATDDAYNKYAESGYDKYTSGEKVGQIIVGDKDTDFIGTNPVNATSVDKPGFHSNDAAKATYDHNGKQEEEIYPHPVIQVAARVDIVKIDEKGGALENARFNLYDNRYDPKKTLEENTAYLIKKDLQSKKSADPEGTEAIIRSGKLTEGTYYLVETQAPAGYNALQGPVKIIVTDTNGILSMAAKIAGVTVGQDKLKKMVTVSGN